MQVSISELINKGQYWSTLAKLETKQVPADLERYQPAQKSWLIRGPVKRKKSLSQLDEDPTEFGR